MTAEFLTHPSLTPRHGFFTRRGGVSSGSYESLNCSWSSADDPQNLAENRRRVAASLGTTPDLLLGLTQIHSAEVITVTKPWTPGQGPKGDALVTSLPGIAIGVITADCAPVLFSDPDAGVIAAAHAGWRGAVGGVLEATINAMIALGATRSSITAVIGPCIAQESYEVGRDLYEAVCGGNPNASRFFVTGRSAAHWQFDLSSYCAACLKQCDIKGFGLEIDTFADPARFFSHRRRIIRNEGAIGHQISGIIK